MVVGTIFQDFFFFQKDVWLKKKAQHSYVFCHLQSSLSQGNLRQGLSFPLMCSLLDCSSLAMAGSYEITCNCRELFFWGLRWYRWGGVGSRLATVKICHNFVLEHVYSAFVLDIYLSVGSLHLRNLIHRFGSQIRI